MGYYGRDKSAGVQSSRDYDRTRETFRNGPVARTGKRRRGGHKCPCCQRKSDEFLAVRDVVWWSDWQDEQDSERNEMMSYDSFE